ncbi:MAG: response regulator [Nitrospirota bacterium]|jgi:PAS domain S-box-containing protein|nr:response regulator [Nitrospirota bacterium]MDH4360213.1 response regulator [Nitrospirota bacterium]MDH5575104.1 response regulator [Nitrospirota bacterium]
MSLLSTKPRVLLVDDDPDILLALSDYLCQEGFQVETAETGAAALQKSAASSYDAVVLDVGLPDRDGLEVLNELSHTHPQLPVILLTAFTSLRNTADPDILDRAFAYLTKPYKRQEVKSAIHRACLAGQVAIEGLPGSSAPTTPFDTFPSLLQPSPSQAPLDAAIQPKFNLSAYVRLAEYVQLMQFAFDHVPDGILIADSEKRLRFANQAACDALGYTREELQTLRIPDIAPNHDNEKFRQQLERLRTGQPLTYPSNHRTKNGQLFPIEISVYLLNFQGQEFTCAITRRIQ